MKVIIIIVFLFLGCASFGQKNKVPKTDTLGHDLHYDTVQAAIMYYHTGKVYKEHHIFGYVAKAREMPDTYNLYFDSSKKRKIYSKCIISVKEMQW